MNNYQKVYSTIVSVVSTEKTNVVGDKFNQYVVLVRKEATKIDIKKAAEHIFKVKVKKVNVLNYKPVGRLFGRRKGVVSGYKKAYIKLYSGHEIIFSELG
jgi:large subunit ribosomal protein L23